MTKPKIYYKKVRDLGTIFSATFGFIKQNFKPLYGSLLFFAGPFLLIASAVSTYMLSNKIGMANFVRPESLMSFYGDMIVAYITSMLILFIGVTIYNVILNRNILENEKLQNGEPLTVKHGIINFWPDFWRILGNTLLLVIVLVVFMAVLVLIFAGIFALAGSGGNQAGVAIVAVLAVLLILVAFFILGPVMAYIPMAAIFVCQRDGIPIFAAIRKVFYYMKSNFWNTWVVSIVGLLSYTVLSGIVQLPVIILTLITSLTRVKSAGVYSMVDTSPSILLVAITAICALLSYGVMVIYHLITVYQYTSLEEKKEGASIIDKINQIQ